MKSLWKMHGGAVVGALLIVSAFAFAPARCQAAFSGPVSVNSNAATDSDNQNQPVLAAGADGTVIAVWKAPGPNPLNPLGNDTGSPPGNDDLFYSRSLDHGKTWSTLAPLKTTAASDFYDDLDPSIATDGHGRWMVAWRSLDPLGGTLGYDADILMTLSSDNGLTWSPPTPVNNDAASDPGGFLTNSDPRAFDVAPKVVCDGQGHWLVGWLRYDNRSGDWQTSSMVATSSDNGAHWSNPLALQTHNSDIYGLGGVKVAADGQGHWIACWFTRLNSNADYDLYYSVSGNFGASWSAPATLNTNAATDSGDDLNPVLAADGQGHWMAAWTSSGSMGSDNDIFYATSNDFGQSWSAPAPVNTDAASDANGNDANPRLVADGQGNWIAVWMTTKLGGDWDIFYATLKQGQSAWSAPQALNPWAAGDSGTNDSGGATELDLASDGLGRWVAAWTSNYNPLTLSSGDYDLFSMTWENAPALPELPLAAPIAINSDSITDTDNESSPAIAAAPDGTIVAVWMAPSLNPLDPLGNDTGSPAGNDDIYFSRSLDRGKTWSHLAPLKRNAAVDLYDDMDPSIATDGHGRWMVVWRSLDPLNGTLGYDADILMALSSDNGLTWSPPTPVNNDAASDPGGLLTNSDPRAFDFQPQVVCDGQSHWVVGWVRYDNRSGNWQTSSMVAASSDNGAHWTTPRALQTRNGDLSGLGGVKLATDRQGRWIACWSARTSSYSDFDLYYAVSVNNGSTWGSAALLNTNGALDSGDDSTPAIAADASGKWIVIWQSNDTLSGAKGTDSDILYTVSANSGSTWSAPAPLNVNAASDTYPKLVWDGKGNWIATWMSNRLGGDLDLMYSTLKQGLSAWAAPQPLNPWAAGDSATDGGGPVELEMASDGLGGWMAAWRSNYNLINGTVGDSDILFSRLHNDNRADPAWLRMR